ncbi:hypothetical protein TDMWS_09710 [Thermodesulfomicrobium sp. WS]|uniref:glycosyltransferase n=1 Tax=Thermodesulfomicrobium sp. WS TaxID=3004129 RepID=UPI002492601E|nr:glycosyltransferase [Thermodesulfomicrobium sp. WS]BDV00886.1 hypothetical protein TDMWS_09710 [Thermodesulfomicrobium sp. WS]
MENVKKLILKKIKEIIVSYNNNRIVKNYWERAHKKNALLSYILAPFKKNKHPFLHTNFFEAQCWSKILDDLGFNVDIIDYRCTKKIDLAKYDLICGFGDVFQRVFELSGNRRIRTIYYGTGMHVCHQNNISLKRVKDVYLKKGVWLGKSARFVEKTWTHQTVLVDGIIALGNEVCANSYRKYYDGIVHALPAPFYETQDGENIIRNRKDSSRRHYLWFGSSGLIHKGLDLCLDYFSRNQDIILHVCGPIGNEKEFVDAYKKELFESPNVRVHGFIDITNKEFHDILSLCSFVIFPSCSEGGAPSVLTAVGNGGLIPIITKETTIKTGYEIWIEGFDYESVDKAIKHSMLLSTNKIKELQYNNLQFVKTNHSQDLYYRRLKECIQNILDSN